MSMKRSTYNTIIIIICIFMMIFAYFNSRNKKQINEAKRLPFTNTSLENVSDGIYEGKTFTSFMHLVLNVTVKDHKLTKIDIIENKGSKGQKANKIIEKMIEENKKEFSSGFCSPQSPSHCFVVKPPNLLPFVVSINTNVLLASSHL